MTESILETEFRELWESLYPKIILEQEKAIIPKRKFRFDFVHFPSKVAIEINGGIWGQSGHSSGKGLQRDYEKLNLAQLEGWRVFQLSGEMITEDWLKRIFKLIEITVTR